MNDSQPSNAHMSSAQLSAVQRQMVATVQQMELRKWAMEKALTHVTTDTPQKMVECAEHIYEFLTRPAADFLIDAVEKIADK